MLLMNNEELAPEGLISFKNCPNSLCEENYAPESTPALIYFGVVPVVLGALRAHLTSCDVGVLGVGLDILLGLAYFQSATHLEALANAGLFEVLLASANWLVGAGIVYESEEDYAMAPLCEIVKLVARLHWAQLSAVGFATHLRRKSTRKQTYRRTRSMKCVVCLPSRLGAPLRFSKALSDLGGRPRAGLRSLPQCPWKSVFLPTPNASGVRKPGPDSRQVATRTEPWVHIGDYALASCSLAEIMEDRVFFN